MATRQSSAGPMTRSRKQREQGNVYFRSGSQDFGFVVKCGRLEAALQCYTNALCSSLTKDETMSARKNVGMATWRLASLYRLADDRDAKMQRLCTERYYRQALENLNIAYTRGDSCMPASWVSHIRTRLEECASEALAWWNESTVGDERVSLLIDAISLLPPGRIKAEEYVKLGFVIFHLGITALGEQRYKEVFRYMKECFFPIEEGERMSGGDDGILIEVGILREDVFLHTCIAESGMAKSTGDSLLAKVLAESEELNIDLVWDIMDWFRRSATLCKDKDLEQEAIAYSRMGKVYGEILNMSVKAKDCYKKAIELALSMVPRNFHGVDWFEESKKFVEDFQRRLHKDESENQEKIEALAEMEEDMTKLADLMGLPVQEFLEKVYLTWPPKFPWAKFEVKSSKKKMLIQAIRHYHPDKVSKEIHGKNWYYLTGEITKKITERYSQEKFLDED